MRVLLDHYLLEKVFMVIMKDSEKLGQPYKMPTFDASSVKPMDFQNWKTHTRLPSHYNCEECKICKEKNVQTNVLDV